MIKYLAIMLLSASLGLIKIFILSALFLPPEFGGFISLFFASSFSAVLLSFGSLEATIKIYSRLWADEKKELISKSALALSLVLFRRYIIFSAALAAIVLVVSSGFNLIDVMLVSALGYGIALSMLVASLFRTSYSVAHQKKFYLFKSFSSFICVIFLAWMFSWQAALLGEVLAIILLLLYSSGLLTELGFSFSTARAKLPSDLLRRGGGRLYFSNLISAAISQLDRVVVRQGLGLEKAGAYGVVSIIYQVSAILVNSIAQRVGVYFIQENHKEVGDQKKIAGVLLCCIVFSVVLGLSLYGAYILLGDISFIATYLERYHISSDMVMCGCAIAVLQIYSLLEFYLISHDRESDVLVANIFCLVVFSSGLLSFSVYGFGVLEFMILMLLSRFIQVAHQLYCISRIMVRR